MDEHDVTMKAAVAILTVSDSRTMAEDQSGDKIADSLEKAGHWVMLRDLIRDEKAAIADMVSDWVALPEVDAIVVTGGTGPGQRDVTPEAILPLFSVKLPGFGELFRQLSYEQIGAASMLSRADAGWIDWGNSRTPVFLLPRSPKAVALAMEKLIIPQLGHLLAVCRGKKTI